MNVYITDLLQLLEKAQGTNETFIRGTVMAPEDICHWGTFDSINGYLPDDWAASAVLDQSTGEWYFCIIHDDDLDEKLAMC